MDEKAHRRLHITFIVIIAALVATLIIFLGPKRIPISIAERMERLQTELRATTQRADALVVKLAEVNGSLEEVGDSVGVIVVGIEHSQQFNSENINAIADSNDAGRIIEGSSIEIGNFIERIERNNSQGIETSED